MMPLRLLDLFSGIGAFSIGLESSDFARTVAFSEINPHASAVLARHWPGVPNLGDVRTITDASLRRAGIAADIICGGFPCTDISSAGRGAGINGERSGLWREYARIVREIRPRFVLVENVGALLARGMSTVLGDLADCGYDAVWRRIAAADVGAPHLRQRIWIVAYARGEQHEGFGDALWREIATELSRAASDAASLFGSAQFGGEPDGDFARGREMADANEQCGRIEQQFGGCDETRARNQSGRRGTGADMADADQPGLERRGEHRQSADQRAFGSGLRAVEGYGRAESEFRRMADGPAFGLDQHSGWLTEPEGLPRVAHKVPDRVARLTALGNAVVPQIPQLIGRAISAAMRTA